MRFPLRHALALFLFPYTLTATSSSASICPASLIPILSAHEKTAVFSAAKALKERTVTNEGCLTMPCTAMEYPTTPTKICLTFSPIHAKSTKQSVMLIS